MLAEADLSSVDKVITNLLTNKEPVRQFDSLMLLEQKHRTDRVLNTCI